MPKREPRVTLRTRMWGIYRQHTYELTWWLTWMLLALGWALWTVLHD
jgi:hypothetical protein